MGVGRTHGDHVRIASRSANRRIAVGARSVVFTQVASRGNDHDAGVPSGFHGLAERIERVAFIHPAGQRQIDDSNVVAAPQGNCLLDSRNYVAVGAGSVLIQHAQIDDGSFGRDALIVARVVLETVRNVSVSGDDSSHVYSVAEVIISSAVPGNEALRVDHARDTRVLVVRQVENTGHAAVDDGYADAGAVPAIGVRYVGIHGLVDHAIGRTTHLTVRRDVNNVGAGGNVVQAAGVHRDQLSVDNRQIGFVCCAFACQIWGKC